MGDTPPLGVMAGMAIVAFFRYPTTGGHYECDLLWACVPWVSPPVIGVGYGLVLIEAKECTQDAPSAVWCLCFWLVAWFCVVCGLHFVCLSLANTLGLGPR